MGETTAVAHGGNPQDRAASPRPRCIAIAVRHDDKTIAELNHPLPRLPFISKKRVN
ncbi:MAG: hypothetical protein F6J90_26255 [Moorea sp. SIOASIH]|uniref:hypothetical protein n=1 Tax=Moorena sp. SIOASIH TaxID=2607817 RepID=UPI0013B96C2D|nr:hypothetical protein [Moorena sp. SIOASIH]NEO39644.1 hypothetical protein [Moorena sp. SIOASIH]